MRNGHPGWHNCMRLLLAAMLLPGYARAQSNATASPSAAQLVGTWQLVSYELTMKDGSVTPSPQFGPHARGFLMYEADGHMCAEIMNPDQPAWKNPSKPTSSEKLATFDSMLAYCGTYTVDAEHSTVTHFPAVSWMPPMVGSAQPRPFRIEGNRFIVTLAGTGPAIVRTVLVWERAK